MMSAQELDRSQELLQRIAHAMGADDTAAA